MDKVLVWFPPKLDRGVSTAFGLVSSNVAGFDRTRAGFDQFWAEFVQSRVRPSLGCGFSTGCSRTSRLNSESDFATPPQDGDMRNKGEGYERSYTRSGHNPAANNSARRQGATPERFERPYARGGQTRGGKEQRQTNIHCIHSNWKTRCVKQGQSICGSHSGGGGINPFPQSCIVCPGGQIRREASKTRRRGWSKGGPLTPLLAIPSTDRYTV